MLLLFILLSMLAVIAASFPICRWYNQQIQVTDFIYSNVKIPAAFDQTKILHISDLHNTSFGSNQTKLNGLIDSVSPDLIFITGDLIDRRSYDLEKALPLIWHITQIAPVYFVSGNHEAWSKKYREISRALTQAGVTILADRRVKIVKGGAEIGLTGLADPGFFTPEKIRKVNEKKLETHLPASPAGFQILLSHRPEHFPLYRKKRYDLIFSGHAHGGQIRLPFIGGLYAPEQGLFPRYTNGKYTDHSSTLFVSRGLGNSSFPLRFHNRPHLIAVTLKSGR